MLHKFILLSLLYRVLVYPLHNWKTNISHSKFALPETLDPLIHPQLVAGIEKKRKVLLTSKTERERGKERDGERG